MSDSVDLSKDNLDKTMRDYGDLLCDNCNIRLKAYCTPIVNKLNKGFPPSPREVIKLTRSLCKECFSKVVNKKLKG